MNLFRYLFSPKMLVPAVTVAVTGILGFTIASQSGASAATCSTNDVIRCGYSTPSDLASKVNGEVSALYNHAFAAGYGIGDLNNFKAHAKHVTVHKDGRVVLDDGTVIATDAQSLGRERIEGNRIAIKINSTTWYYGSTRDNFASETLGGYALLNEDHSLKFAALTACGNPVWGNTPGYKCQMLNQKKVNSTTYEYNVASYTKGNSNVSKVVIDYGDGKSDTLTSNFTQTVTHTYAPGKYTARATVYFKVNGQDKSDTRAECTKPVDVPQPPKPVFVCDSLKPTQISRTKYSFTATGASKNATFVSAKFDFGDNQSAADIKGTGERVTVGHEYAKEGTYTVKAYLTYKEGTTPETANCVVKVTINEQTCADKPNAPECQPPKQECKPNIPMGDSRCSETPQVLPSTGPAEIIGTTLGLGTIAGAGMYYRSSRRNLIDTILKR